LTPAERRSSWLAALPQQSTKGRGMHKQHEAYPHGPMRRKDREIADREEIDAIFHTGKVMYIALADDNVPFLVPVFYAYDGEAVYFHSAQVGTKIDILKRNPKVCFAISLDHGIAKSDTVCDFEAKHRTIIGVGVASFVDEKMKKVNVLDRIVAKFTDQKFEYPTKTLDRTAVVRIAIESIKGKKHGLS
jgi:uncharacterized protein